MDTYKEVTDRIMTFIKYQLLPKHMNTPKRLKFNYLPADPEVDQLRLAERHYAAMHANDLRPGQLLFAPLILLASVISALLPLAYAIMDILGTWVLIVMSILVFILLLTYNPHRH